MTNEITREDLREAIRDMAGQMRDGFDGVHSRLDELNGRTRKAENAIAVHDERWTRLDRATTVAPSSSSPIGELKGDWKTMAMMGSLASGAVSGLIWGLFKIVQFIQAIAK